MFRLYNTLTGQVEAIRPRRGGLLRMYGCGPAAHRSPDIADLRSALLTDLIRRHAEHRHGLTVLTCQVISDTPCLAADTAASDTAAGHTRPGDTPAGHTRPGDTPAGHTTPGSGDALRADGNALNLLPADYSPRASDSIGLITDLIRRLVEGGHAYPVPGGSLCFDALSYPGYGELSGNRLAGPGPGPGDRPASEAGVQKRSPADWVLWRAAAAPGPAWPAPWGTGLPGGPAGCSALSLRCLGDVIDIHTGPADLLFPHHEDERAQSNAVTGHEVVRLWAHGGPVLFDGAAMTGPAGQALALPDLTGRGLDPLALRLAFLDHRYRRPAALSWGALESADLALRRWRALVAEWANSPSRPMPAGVDAEVTAAFDADLDTPAALRALRGAASDPQIAPGSKFELFARADQLLGLDLARDVGRPPARPPSPSREQRSNDSPA